jgi:deazaflavin-dependent oxidoreductase (nitroreductase family)
LGYIMVLTHTGRKSGLRRRTPVNFAEIGGDLAEIGGDLAEIGGDLYCLAGFGAAADWYRNLLANPQVEVWLPDGSWYAGTAADISGLPDPQRLPILRQVLINSGFAGLLAGLRPHTMSDAALKRATAAYKLVRVRRTAPRTGSGGPGDLASVWIVIAALLAVLALLPRRNRNRPA